MRLEYDITRNITYDSIPKRGYCIIKLDENGIGTKVRLQSNIEPIQKDEYAVFYTAERWRFSIGAESYFFEEGQAERYEAAKYGGMKIDNKGNSLLIGLYDNDLNKIE